MSYTPKNFYIIDEDRVNSDKKICGTECLFKYNFQEQSTSYKACISDTSINHLKMPYIKISNEYLSTTTNTGVIAVNFQNNNYWFDGIYITKPGYIFTESKIQNVFPDNIVSIDSSACSLVIVCTTGKNNFLTIVQTIIPRQSITSNNRNTTLNNIIMDIDNRTKTDDKPIPDCAADGLTVATVNINNLIPHYDDFFFYPDDNKSTTFNLIAFSASKTPILISNATEKILEDFFSETANLPLLSSFYQSLPGTTSKIVFKSSQKPINNLSEGEDDIYIKCQPTDQEGEILVSGQSIAPVEQQFDLGSMLNIDNNWFTSAMMGILIMLVIMKGTELLLKSGTRGILGGN